MAFSMKMQCGVLYDRAFAKTQESSSLAQGCDCDWCLTS